MIFQQAEACDISIQTFLLLICCIPCGAFVSACVSRRRETIYLHILARFPFHRWNILINSGPRPSQLLTAVSLRSVLVNPCPLFGKWAHYCRDQIEEEPGRRLLWRRWEYNIKMNIKLKVCKKVDWIEVLQSRVHWWAVVALNHRVP
jgi:hypothetical protein